MPDTPWRPVAADPPPEGVAVETKIDDGRGVRNVQPLTRQGRLWFLPGGDVYCYYQPTHWRPREEAPRA